MEQYIPKDTLVAKIEKRFDEYSSSILRHYDACTEARASELGKILVLLNTLEVKEVDINKEISQFIDTNFEEATIGHKLSLRRTAKHFFELGLRSTITKEDCKLIWNIGDEIPYMPEKEFFKELLKRYKTQKGEEYDRQRETNKD